MGSSPRTLAGMALNRVRPRAKDDPRFALRIIFLFVVEFAFTRGWRYSFDREPLPAGIQLISGDDPRLGALCWGIAWFAAAAVALGGIIGPWPFASIGVAVLSLSFALGFTLSWLTSHGEGPDYANAGTYWFVLGVLAFGYPLSRRALKRAPLPPRAGA